MKNLAVNRLRVMPGHQTMCDTDPTCLTLPILDLAGAKEWKPCQEHWVAVIGKDATAHQNEMGFGPVLAAEKGRCAAEATREDLVKATYLLVAMRKGRAEIASGTREGAVVGPLDFLKEENKEDPDPNSCTAKMKAPIDSIGCGNGQVHVPLSLSHHPRVLKVKVEHGKFDYKIPHPMLLAMKAAINWHFVVTGMKLLHACDPLVDTEKAEIERLNDEHCYDVLEEMMWEEHRPKSLEDLA